MKKLFLTSIMITTLLFGDTIMIDNFKTDIFSKNTNSLQKIKLSIVVDTNQTTEDYKVKDGLNIVISSFYLEDLFTSKAKESFKELLKSYLKKKQNIDITHIYIEDLQKIDTISKEDLKKMIQNIKEKK